MRSRRKSCKMVIGARKWGRAFFAAAFSTLMYACGIPSTSYLPQVPIDSVVQPIGSETDYSFSIPDQININIFEGFEIYYKFFIVDDTLDAKGDTSLPDPVSFLSLTNSGYSRLSDSLEISTEFPDYPLIPMDEILIDPDVPDPSTEIRLQFSNEGTSALPSVLVVDKQDFITRVFRTLKDGAGLRQLKGFTPADFVPNDSDLPANFDAGYFDIIIALYVLSYGNDYSELSFNIHSVAVYLGSSSLLLSQ